MALRKTRIDGNATYETIETEDFSMNQKSYKIRIDATICSTLEESVLKERLAVSLYDIETMKSVNDCESEELEVAEYDFVEVFETHDI